MKKEDITMKLSLTKVKNGWVVSEELSDRYASDIYVFQNLWDLHTHLQNMERLTTNQSVIPTEL